MAVYLDVYLTVNAVLNALTLFVVARVSGHSTTPKRMCLSIVVGTAYSVLYLLPYAQITCSWPARLVVLLVMVLMAFDPCTWWQLVRLSLYYFLAVSVLGGAANALTGDSSYPLRTAVPVSGFGVVLAAVAAVMIGAVLWRHLRASVWKEPLFVSVEVTVDGDHLAIKTLLDTGNSLTDPLSKQPVLVVRYGAIKSLLPRTVAAVIRQPLDIGWPNFSGVDAAWLSRLRLIPFSSIGHHNGWLLAFRPDQIRFQRDNKWCVCHALIAVVDDKFLPQGSFAGLMHPAVMQLDTR